MGALRRETGGGRGEEGEQGGRAKALAAAQAFQSSPFVSYSKLCIYYPIVLSSREISL